MFDCLTPVQGRAIRLTVDRATPLGVYVGPIRRMPRCTSVSSDEGRPGLESFSVQAHFAGATRWTDAPERVTLKMLKRQVRQASSNDATGAHMEVSTETLVDMLLEVEAEDPIDYADLPFGEQELRRLVMTSLVERHHVVEDGMSVSDIHAMYLLSTAKLVLENTVLHARILMLQGHQVDVQSLLAPFTLKGKQ